MNDYQIVEESVFLPPRPLIARMLHQLVTMQLDAKKWSETAQLR